ncbi:protocatechuate 3,4-dioxygenase subunit alpha [Leucobacter soli]|uniref:Protocatechuate 3,4-dioxygenase alpha chain n=1 Tax=Leucobacter soli TaxID=2812850 RepID=A0A916JYA5_9MICO|nr:protocatechuate 3,4-dioxygenase subunit alpha [Leucobacter soli]CAG7611830.1 Protocatechuate 3,4-dioxygenase alpha chain [Leucobacter soli]
MKRARDLDTSAVPERTLVPTPGQTVGPFFAFGTDYEKKHEVVHPHSPGSFVLSGRVLDGQGDPVPDSMVEIWQADSDGTVPMARGAFARDGHTFTGFGRAFTTDEGHFEFWTREPGSVDGEAPFFVVIVYARGLPNKLHTRFYLPENEAANAADPLLSSLDDDERATLILERTPDGGLRRDIRLQGEGETVFIAF